MESGSGIVVGELIGQLELLKTFSCEFSKTFKACYFTNPIVLIKRLHYRLLSGKLQTISEHSKETFVLESICVEVGNFGQQA